MASNFRLTWFLSFRVLANSSCKALLAELDVVVISCPDSLSIYCTNNPTDINKSAQA